MHVKEIAQALNATEAQVEKAIEGMGDINPSMLSKIGEKINGGKMAIATPKSSAPVVADKATKATAKTRRSTKMKQADEALAIRRDEAAIEVKQVAQQSTQPQVLEALEISASDVDVVGDVANKIAKEVTADVAALTQLMNPVVRTLKTVGLAQERSAQMTEALAEKGITVASILEAAIPAMDSRPSLDSIFAAEKAAPIDFAGIL
ncbi:MAG: hypothetical protein ACRC62_31685 [Microcoleus sp.]